MYKIIKLKKIDSTNNFAKLLFEYYKLEELDRTVICTQQQTNGRGTGNNKWISEPGKNLTFSIIYAPQNLPLDQIFYLSKTISCGIVDFLQMLGIKAKIKWPNDIYVNDKKICGILIENSILGHRIHYSIIGIGLNVNQTHFPGDLNATSIKLILNQEIELSWALEQLLDKIFYWLDTLEQNKFDQIDQFYLDHLYLLGKKAAFRRDGHILDAKIIGVDNFGRLILQTSDTQSYQTFNQKEIELLKPL